MIKQLKMKLREADQIYHHQAAAYSFRHHHNSTPAQQVQEFETIFRCLDTAVTGANKVRRDLGIHRAGSRYSSYTVENYSHQASSLNNGNPSGIHSTGSGASSHIIEIIEETPNDSKASSLRIGGVELPGLTRLYNNLSRETNDSNTNEFKQSNISDGGQAVDGKIGVQETWRPERWANH